jgi:leucyl aminopeptidase
MNVQFYYLKNTINRSNLSSIIFINDKNNLESIKNQVSKSDYLFISDLIKSKDPKKQILTFEINSKKTFFLISLKKDLKSIEVEKLGAELYNFIKNKNYINGKFLLNTNYIPEKLKNFIGYFFHGFKLKSYEFNKYKSNQVLKKISIYVLGKNIPSIKNEIRFKAIERGTVLARDLVSEPGNILHPDEYTKRINSLKKYGLKIAIYNKKILKKLGMNALLGVGQGSNRGSYLATIQWNGLDKKTKPLAFVGKGVCFDTGGISLKPAKFMEDMTYDMAGSAVVVGLMKTLALRKAKVNAVGVVGLVENMPDGNAQRPGDIVKSYSGKTIEILNTDAEGRLVLADALSYTEKKFKPKFIVDLATLTGAIIVSLGSEYAGLFSNDDKISDQLTKAGEKVGEKVWRMPLNDNYDKLINSKKADMQNINYVGGAGSTTAAQFLQRFILNKTPWAHLDIAGMAFSKYGGALNSGGATGYGVRLLNQLIEDNYE